MVTHPMKQGTYTTSSGYGPRWGTHHNGIDFAAPVGTPIYAPADGVVIEGRDRRQGSVSGFGSWIWLDCQASVGKDFIYGHVHHPGILVKRGDRVKEGQQIGVVGNEGQSTGPHLHFEVWGPPGRSGGKHEDPAKWLFAAHPQPPSPAPHGAGFPHERSSMVTIIDTAARPPTPDTIKGAGHKGQVVYISPDRTGGGLPGKPVTRAHVDAMRAAGLSVACVWQFGKDSASAPPDVMRGADGGRADAHAAQKKLDELGLNDWPVFFAVDFDITIAQWNSVAVHYFRAAAEVLGRHRVGIYGHSKVCHWAGPEDKVIGEVAPGRYLAWQTRSWSGGVVAKDYAVLYQRIIDTKATPGPKVGGVVVDVNDTLFEYWGQGPNGYRSAADLAAGELTPKELEKYLKVQPDEVRLMNKHFTPGRGGKKIRYITRHHLAGVGTTKDVWNWWQTRAASAHYVIEPSTRVGQLVWDRDTAWSNSNSVSNQETIAIEHTNSAGAAQDYPIADNVIIAGARWAAALCLFYGLGKPEHGKNIRDHREFGATSCPHHLARGGKYHQQWMDEAQAFYDVLVAAKAGNATAPKPTPGEQKPPAPTPPKENIVTTLDTIVRGYAGGGIKAPLKDFILHADRNSFDAMHAALRCEERLGQIEEKLDRLLAEK